MLSYLSKHLMNWMAGIDYETKFRTKSVIECMPCAITLTEESWHMTRINVVPVEELCDQHLLAEHRELTRIPNDIVKRNGAVTLSDISRYTLGKGHVTFFRDKLTWLFLRYQALYMECRKRGFDVTYNWPDTVKAYVALWNDYKVTQDDIDVNRLRLDERWPLNARFSQYKKVSVCKLHSSPP
jgi:deoxyribonuclease (pyrimidine dimer)